MIGSAGLNPLDTDVDRVVDGDTVTVTVRHVARTGTPLIGYVLPDVVLTASASMFLE